MNFFLIEIGHIDYNKNPEFYADFKKFNLTSLTKCPQEILKLQKRKKRNLEQN
jgi:hypothetical protein